METPPQPAESAVTTSSNIETKEPWHASLNRVTTVSKILAAVVFITLPFVGFYLGMQFSVKQPSVELTTEVVPTKEQSLVITGEAATTPTKLEDPNESVSDAAAYNFNQKVMEIFGDLNGDSLSDKVIVMQDSTHEKAPYQLQVFFRSVDEEYKLVVTSVKIIEPQYPDGRDGLRTGNSFSEVVIKDGVLRVRSDLLRGYFEHRFRFQNGNFELVGFSKTDSTGNGVVTDIDFNLVTGERIIKTQRYDRDEVLSDTKEVVSIRPLPRLQDITPMESEMY